jgi:hypothetical protein
MVDLVAGFLRLGGNQLTHRSVSDQGYFHAFVFYTALSAQARRPLPTPIRFFNLCRFQLSVRTKAKGLHRADPSKQLREFDVQVY